MESLISNERRAKTLILFLWIFLIMELISLVSGVVQYGRLTNSIVDVSVSAEVLNTVKNRQLEIIIASVIMVTICSTVFIRWFYRAYSNLEKRITYVSYSVNMTRYSWFVPILGLYRPLQIMKDMYSRTSDYLTENGVTQYNRLSITMLGWWWGFWMLDLFLSRVVLRYTQKAVTTDDLFFVLKSSITENIVGVIATILIIKVVKDYARVEPLLLSPNGKTDSTQLHR